MVLAGLNCQAWAEDASPENQKRYEFQRVRMGVPWNLQFYAASDELALQAADRVYARIKELDRSMSNYDPDSELNQLCKNSGPGKPVTVSPELFQVLQASLQFSERSAGAFDITVGPITELWRKAWRKRTMPAPELLQSALKKVGSEKIRLDATQNTVELLVPEMQLDLGAIAKGYAADEALRVLKSLGISRALVDASGDIVVGDAPPGKMAWVISIEPLSKTAGQQESTEVEFLQLVNAAVATSGDANRHVEIAGVRYSHLVDPQTGIGLTIPSSVTVIARDGMTADALASAVSVLGPEKSRAVLKHYSAEFFMVLKPAAKEQTFESCGYQRYRVTSE